MQRLFYVSMPTWRHLSPGWFQAVQLPVCTWLPRRPVWIPNRRLLWQSLRQRRHVQGSWRLRKVKVRPWSEQLDHVTCYVNMLHVHVTCAIVHVTWTWTLNMLHVHVTWTCYICMLHEHVRYVCMLHKHVTFSCHSYYYFETLYSNRNFSGY